MFFPQDGGKIHSKVCTVDKIYGSNKYLFLITPESITIKPVLSSCEKKYANAKTCRHHTKKHILILFLIFSPVLYTANLIYFGIKCNGFAKRAFALKTIM